jgi:hypothetical protein
MEEFVKYSIVMRPHFHLFGDRFSERTERAEKQLKQLESTTISVQSTNGIKGTAVVVEPLTIKAHGVDGTDVAPEID